MKASKLSLRLFWASIVVILVVVDGIPTSSASDPSSDSNSGTTSVASNLIPGVSVDNAGTFHYSNTLQAQQAILNPKTTVLQGVRNSSGACVFAGPASSVPVYQEETAFNPTTCVETIVSGQLSPKGLTTLAAMSPASGTLTSSTATSTSTSALPSNNSSATPSVSALATSYNGTWSAFSKVAFIDPINLTIVSLSNNFSWKIANSSVVSGSTSPSAYMEHIGGDVTTSTGSGTYYVNLGGGSAIQSFTYNNWSNSDFEAWVVAVLGPPGYAACGFNANPAQFYLAPNVTGYNNSSYNASWSDTVSGGCTDLVHFNSLSGTGSHS